MYRLVFQSTRPARGATLSASVISSSPYSFQSTRPARGATSPGGHYSLIL